MSNPIYSYAIVETNKVAALKLKALMNRYFKDIECVGMYHTSRTALNGLKKYLPDLIFMDVFLERKKTCFEILDAMPPDDYRIIFITESEAHIKQALEYNTVQYVDKPIGLKALRSCIEKAQEMKFKPKEWPTRLRETMYEEDEQNIRINLMDGEGEITRVPIRDVLYFQGGGKGNRYSIAVLDKNGVSKKKLLFSKPFGQLESYHGLPECFIFFEKKCIINTENILAITKDDTYVIFDEKTSLKLGKDLMKQLKEFLGI